MTEREALKEQQKDMYCYNLCRELKKLNPRRLQCCEHPINLLIKEAYTKENREYAECEFEDEICYSFYVDQRIIETKYERAKTDDKGKVTITSHMAVVERNPEGIEKIINFIVKNNKSLKDGINRKKLNLSLSKNFNK